jgi:predicted small metal-binding protein
MKHYFYCARSKGDCNFGIMEAKNSVEAMKILIKYLETKWKKGEYGITQFNRVD